VSGTGPVVRFVRTPKGALLLAFLPLLVLGGASSGATAALPHLLVAVAGAYLADLLPGWVARGPFRRSTGPLLTGLIVAFVLGVETPAVVTLAVAVLATASKFVLRTERGHIFNPAGLALAAAVPLWGTDQSWWGALPDQPWPLVLLMVLLGAVVVDRVAKWPMVLSFLGVYFGLFTVVGLAQPAAVAEMFRGPFVQAALFMSLFMLTDPPTSPGRDRDQLWMGALAAAVCCGAQLAGAGQIYLLLGLLVANAALGAQRIVQRLALRAAATGRWRSSGARGV
jgi:Na+-transporting NADH:ubiquinone oxidoreductase subunit NqrB